MQKVPAPVMAVLAGAFGAALTFGVVLGGSHASSLLSHLNSELADVPASGTVRVTAVEYTRQRILAFQNAVMGGTAMGSEMPLQWQTAANDHEPGLADPVALAEVSANRVDILCRSCVPVQLLSNFVNLLADRRSHAPLSPFLCALHA